MDATTRRRLEPEYISREIEHTVAIHDHTLFGRSGTNGHNGILKDHQRRIAALEVAADHAEHVSRQLTDLTGTLRRVFFWVLTTTFGIVTFLLVVLWQTGGLIGPIPKG